MNLLFVNMLNDVEGHKAFDCLFVNSVSNKCNVFLVSQYSWYKSSFANNVKLLFFKKRKNIYVDFYLKLRFIKKTIKKYNIDLVVFSTFHLKKVGLYLKYFRLKNLKIALIHHNTIDILSNNPYISLKFDKYKNFVFHFVFEQFIRDYFVKKFNVYSGNVFVVPHPINPFDFVEKTYDCVSLGNYKDDAFANYCINLEKEHSLFSNNNLKIFIKSRFADFDNGYLCVRKGYLSDDEYVALLDKACYSIIFYPHDFKYRVSGIAFDSIAHNAKIIGNKIELFKEYSKMYPGLFVLIDEQKDIVDFLLKKITYDMNDKHRKDFVDKHNCNAVSNAVIEAVSFIFGDKINENKKH